MIKRSILGGLVLTSVLTLSGCGKKPVHEVKEIFEHVYEVPTYQTLDEEYADKYYADNYDNWEKTTSNNAGGGCSAIKTVLDDGTIAVGRNLDLNISNKCAYIVRTNVPNKHKTVGLAYTFRDISPDLAKLKKDGGLQDDFYKALPFMCDDVLNDKGLYIEINMRSGEYWPTGEDKFACEGTNEHSDKRVYVFELPRYIAENCSSLEEAKEYIKTLNVYTKEHYWSYAFLICDRLGNSSILEFGLNSYYWNDDKICQANFYLNEECYDIERIYSGLGRYDTLMAGIGDVHDLSDLYELMKSVNYYHVYTPYECPFDPRSENIGAVPYFTYEYIFDESHKEEILAMMDAYGKTVKALSRQQQMDLNCYWESSYTATVDITNREFTVRFFEDDTINAKIAFDSTTPSNH